MKFEGTFARFTRLCACVIAVTTMTSNTATSATRQNQVRITRQDQCGDVLQRTEVHKSYTLVEKLALLQSINSEQAWSSATKMDGGLTAIFADIPLTATTDYSAFQNWQSSYLQEYHYSLDLSETNELVTSFLPDAAIDAWRQCMIGTQGLFLYATDVSNAGVTFRVEWVAPVYPQNVKAHIVRPVIVGAKLNGPWPFPTTVTSSSKFTLSVNRDPTKEIRINFPVGVGPWAPSLVVPPEPPPFVDSCTINPTFSRLTMPSASVLGVCRNFEPGRNVVAKYHLVMEQGNTGPWTEFNLYLNNQSTHVEHIEPMIGTVTPWTVEGPALGTVAVDGTVTLTLVPTRLDCCGHPDDATSNNPLSMDAGSQITLTIVTTKGKSSAKVVPPTFIGVVAMQSKKHRAQIHR